MQKIVPHLWYDKDARTAAEWYCSLFENAAIDRLGMIEDTPSGDTETVSFHLENLELAAISAGPYFSLNPSISLMVSCQSAQEVDRLYEALCHEVLMPLDTYPFSPRYGWVQDKYGLSWQLMLTESVPDHPKIRPCLLFGMEVCGRAEEATDAYVSILPDSHKGLINRYGAGEAPDGRAKINYGEITLGGLSMVVMDHGAGGDFTFNEAFSFMVLCENQQEIDAYWDKLTHVPESEQCGWLKDRFGLSWQIVPEHMGDVYMSGTEEETRRVTEAFLKMKKLDIAALEKARFG